ncbi:hypothetical protein HPB47_028491 [Ixodes persulcatus]|uniref:Uncharacterized protein n=1 Tax=Ixodes persulcatus TaxID=34615 RepID=A0AC60PT28_IXOPE|nr:hypothetical protein HPB47_028491 [Ixodes persulcatus]
MWTIARLVETLKIRGIMDQNAEIIRRPKLPKLRTSLCFADATAASSATEKAGEDWEELRSSCDLQADSNELTAIRCANACLEAAVVRMSHTVTKHNWQRRCLLISPSGEGKVVHS